MNFEPEVNALLQRFENTISQGAVQYYDTDDLETIIEAGKLSVKNNQETIEKVKNI